MEKLDFVFCQTAQFPFWPFVVKQQKAMAAAFLR